MKKVKLTYKKVLTVLFSLVIFAFFISVCERFVRSAILGQDVTANDGASANAEETGSKTTDWTKDFPFSQDYENSGYKFVSEEESAASAESKAQETDASLVSSIESAVKSVEDKVDYYTTQLLALRIKFVELNAGFNKAIGMKMISGADSVIVLKNGYLVFDTERKDMTAAAENITLFSKKMNEQGIDFLYVQEPAKLDKYDNKMPYGMNDNENANADDLVKVLDKNGVNCLDLRELMQQQGIDHYSAFFRTDHHWKPETGIWATGEIIKKMNEISGLNMDSSVGDISKYNIKVYKNYMLGSQGRNVSLSFADPEDISIITPKQNNKQYKARYYEFSTSYTEEGDFKEAFLAMSTLDKIDYYNVSVYSTYFYGNHERVSIENKNADNDIRILYIPDSFSNSVIPYMAAAVKYIDVVDIRYFNGSLETFIEKNKPDMIVVAYNPSAFSNSVGGAFDFR